MRIVIDKQEKMAKFAINFILDKMYANRKYTYIETLIKRFVNRLEYAVAYYHLNGKFSLNDGIIRLKLEFAEFEYLLNLDMIARNLLLISFTPSEWLSAEQYLLESSISDIEIEFYYRHIDGSLTNISGLKYIISSKDIFTIAESEKWDFHLRKEPNAEIPEPEPLKRFDQIKGHLYSMILIGSQTEKLSTIINSNDTIGENMLNQLKLSYKDITSSIISYIKDCKNYVDSVSLGKLSDQILLFCNSIIKLCHSGDWLSNTAETRALLNDLNNSELPIKKLLLFKWLRTNNANNAL